MRPPDDTEARRRIATELETTFVVEAAVGTGKTTALIGRVIAILRAGRARLAEIVAVTFTEKAAGEMRLRLRSELERAHAGAADPEERARFEAALAELEAARIGTIHAFCADLLRERPVEAAVDPAFSVLAEEADRRLVERAFDAWFSRRLEAPEEGVRRLLRRPGDPRATLLRAAQELVERRDHPAPWRRPAHDREAELDAIVEALRGLAALPSLAFEPSDYLARALTPIARFVAELDERERVRPRDHDAIEGALVTLRRGATFRDRGYGTWYGEGLLRQDVLSRRDLVQSQIDAFREAAEADLAARLKDELAPVVEAYEALSSRSGALDFLALLMRTRDLLVRDPVVREELRSRARRIFVDEFQDTDPLQAEILLLLASEGPVPAGGMLAEGAPPPVPGKLFVVGDPKQSIYRFRRAEVALYERLKQRLLGQGVSLLHLTRSFRAPPDVQRVVNTAFSVEMQGAEDGSQAEYVPLAEQRPAPKGRPSVIALPVPRPYAPWGKVTGKAVSESTPDAVAAFLDWVLHESGWTFEDPLTKETRAFASRDVCLLFRSTVSYGRSRLAPYVQALEARGIQHVLVGGRAGHDREEVLALANALRAIEHPRDGLSVYATLRGPFVALTDEQLLLHRTRCGSLSPLAPPSEAALAEPALAEVAEALAILRELHVRRNRRPIADTLARFLDATRAHAGVAHWPSGEQALRNVLRVLDLARSFEEEGATSFRAFVEHLDDRLARGEGVDAPVVEERAEGVRLMTVHKAKGLEMPIVVLCDPTEDRGASDRLSRYVDSAAGLWAAPLAGCAPLDLLERREAVLRADAAEEIRLGYVAATRARELLVVPCVGDEPISGWVDPLHRALYPPSAERRAVRPAPGCPAFGEDSVLERPEKARTRARSTVPPGLHRIAGADVVWWDPAQLRLGVHPQGGLRHTSLLEAGPEGSGDARAEAYLGWVTARAEASARAAVPTWRARPVTAIALETEVTTHAPALEGTSAPRATRPSGARFGTLVHGVLAECPLDAEEPAVRAMALHLGRRLEATASEIEAAAEAVRLALTHPLLVEARAALEVRREVPLTVPLEDGTSAEGVVDLAYRDARGWTIVDFKTDREREPKVSYAAQLEVYARAVAAATGEPARTVLFYV